MYLATFLAVKIQPYNLEIDLIALLEYVPNGGVMYGTAAYEKEEKY